MRLMAICGALLVAGCGQPELTEAHRKEMVEIAKSQASGGAALAPRMSDLETRLFAAETKNLELEIEVDRLKEQVKKASEDLDYLKNMTP